MKTAMWRVPYQRRRCLVPADGFYEWKVAPAGEDHEAPKSKDVKQPYGFSMKDSKPFAFGILDAWKDPTDGGWVQSFAIVTTEPNELTATVHNRMPLILDPKAMTGGLNAVPVAPLATATVRCRSICYDRLPPMR